MDEDISIINRNTRNEKIRNFFIKNKKILIISLSTIILIIFGFFGYQEIQKSKKNKIAEKYNSAIIDFISADKKNVKNKLIQTINEKDSTYSPLALYFIIDNEIDASKEEINKYFEASISLSIIKYKAKGE
jgi:predicted negative regulator of RcsB-dependent stress response